MDSLDPAGVVSIRPVVVDRPVRLDEEPKLGAIQFTAITFHPIRPVVYLATERVVYGTLVFFRTNALLTAPPLAYDLSMSALLGHVKVSHTERITHVLASATHPFLIGAIDVQFSFLSFGASDISR